MSVRNEYLFEGHTIRNLNYGTPTASYVATDWIRMTHIDEVCIVLLKELGAAGSDPTLKWEAKTSGSSDTAVSVTPEYIIGKQGNALTDIATVAWKDRMGDFNASTKEWTNTTIAEDALILVASFFPETLIRVNAKFTDVRMALKGTADTGQHYMVTSFARRNDDEPLFSSINARLVR